MKAKRFLLVSVATLLLTGCGSSDDTSLDNSVTDTTTRAVVTLAPKDESSSEDSSASDLDDIPCTPLMWKVTDDNGHEMYFLGSMHSLKADSYPLPEQITSAYENADCLAVECDITNTATSFAIQLTVSQNMIYSDGDKLKNHISEETYNGVSDFLSANGLDITDYESYKTWAISSVCEEVVTGATTNLNSSLGIDRYLLNQAHDDNKEIYEIESMEFQADLLMGFSDGIYDSVLSAYSADSLDSLVQGNLNVYALWKAGSLSQTEEFLSNENTEYMTDEQKASYEEYNKLMLDDRNVNMAESAEQLLSENESTLFVVGLAHFIGEGGIIDLLEQRGYTIEQVVY